ncbi:hypothetical protein, partial [Syntrophorhabdus aromaticivorans]|uniref:hypothetical protein n=1 Tax=Syntrophorhabdus aromaticivorans TaxID=328301 RepID=UPI00056D8B3F
KAIRFHLINLPGRIVDHARGLSIRLTGDHPSLDILIKARMENYGAWPCITGMIMRRPDKQAMRKRLKERKGGLYPKLPL